MRWMVRVWLAVALAGSVSGDSSPALAERPIEPKPVAREEPPPRKRAPDKSTKRPPRRDQDTARKERPEPAPIGESCCVMCSKGVACGNSCISRRKTCHKPRGCACNAGD